MADRQRSDTVGVGSSSIQLGVQLYAIRGPMATDRPAALSRLTELGFTLVETFGPATDPDPVATAEALRRELDAAGLQAVAAHTVAPVGDMAERSIEAMHILGARWLVISGPRSVPGFDNDVFHTADGVRRLAATLTGAGRTAAAAGLRLAFHNHGREIEPLPDGRRPYDILAAAAPELELEVDVYWAQAGGAAPAALIDRYRDRVRLLHLKDGPSPLGQGQPQCAVGAGVVDNAGALGAAHAAEYAFLEIDQCPGDPFDLLAAGASWLAADDRPEQAVRV